jgi:hypothetical protein
LPSKTLGGAADFRCTRQKSQHRAVFIVECAQDRAGHLRLDAFARVAAEIARVHIEGAALAFNDRRVAENFRDARTVERRRHGENAQVLAQSALGVERKRQAQIGIERALVKFVEQDGGDPGQFRIVEHKPRKHTLGHDLDARPLRNFRAETDAQADRLADLLAKACRHARGGGTRRDPARLEHQDFAARKPGLTEQSERHARRLARTGVRDQHRVSPGNQRFPQGR